MLLTCGLGELFRVPWTARRSNQSILKEISPEYSLEGIILKLKLQYFGYLIWRLNSLEKILFLDSSGKDPDAGKDLRQEEKETKEDKIVGWHHQLDGHEFEQARVWEWWNDPGIPLTFPVDSASSWDATGTPGILSRPSRERIPPLELVGGNWAPLDVGGTLVHPLEWRRVYRGTSWVAARVWTTVWNFQRLGVISLYTQTFRLRF